MLAKRFVSSKNRRGIDKNKLENIAQKKTQVLKNQNSNIARGATEKTPFQTKNNHFEKSHNSENFKKGDTLGFLKVQFVAKYQNN